MRRCLLWSLVWSLVVLWRGNSGDLSQRSTTVICGFLLQCELYFGDQPISDYEKETVIITLLTGRTLEWATAPWDSGSGDLRVFPGSWPSFVPYSTIRQRAGMGASDPFWWNQSLWSWESPDPSEERERWSSQGLCLFCRERGHGEGGLLGPDTEQERALIDSRAAGSFIDQSLVTALPLLLRRLRSSIPIQALGGRPVGSGSITHVTCPVTLTSNGCHRERLELLVLFRGLRWLQKHNPIITWSKRKGSWMVDEVLESLPCLTGCSPAKRPGVSLGEQVYIRRYSSPASASFYFVKKDGGLRPCID
ncbi:uncharacterized protein LOC117593616 [Esox lucius]|uniref:uncharacterized protein LOC117593616 n=1 Tax=Esox lucius TaxID=8010 RepID=UPI001476B258|nr:uncharacterized protein LOC117593616 [Esox lucius]